MKRVHVLVEGQTEEAFINRLVAPFLTPHVALIPIILSTKRTKTGRKFRGGITSFAKLRRELLLLLGDTSATVTTMIDYHGLPQDFPGLDELPPGDAYARVEHLERSLFDDLDNPRFLPYLSLHEFEALLFVDLEAVGAVVSALPQEHRRLTDSLTPAARPEEIDDGDDTHPSARLQTHLPRYQKLLHGLLIANRIGLPRMREACPHFNRWIEQLQALGASP